VKPESFWPAGWQIIGRVTLFPIVSYQPRQVNPRL
jgi:hypothetical protein